MRKFLVNIRKNKIVVYEGEFYYIDNKTEEDKEQIQWCRDVDVKIWDNTYKEIDLGDTKIKIDPTNWTNGNITQTYTSTDSQSGINRYQYSHDTAGWADCPNPWVINWDGQWNFYIRAIDNAGNVSGALGMYTIRRDTPPPNAFTPTISNITYSGFRINASTTDSVSGVARYYYYVNGVHKGTTTATYLDVTGLAEETQYSIYVIAEDGAGNQRISTTVNATTLLDESFGPIVDAHGNPTIGWLAIKGAAGTAEEGAWWFVSIVGNNVWVDGVLVSNATMTGNYSGRLSYNDIWID